MSTIQFTDHHGLILQNINVRLIFWGTAWSNINSLPTMGDVTDAIQNMLVGPYMSLLIQYRNIRKGRLNGITIVPGAMLAHNPPNPFTNADVEELITRLINAGVVPNPSNSQLFYCVVMPPNVGFSDPNVIGEHTYFVRGNQNVHYAWITNNGTLNNVTTIFSHELVETCTDPEGSAILGNPGTCQQGGWCEIGDVCSSTGNLNGVVVQSYWSQRDSICVIPTAKDDKDTKENKDSKDNKEGKENKEDKETKDHKDHKEAKDGAKEKDKDKELDTIESLSSVVSDISQRIGKVEQDLSSIRHVAGTGKPFITAEERPQVGGQVLRESTPEKGGQVLRESTQEKGGQVLRESTPEKGGQVLHG
jgi:hypothetical protein